MTKNILIISSELSSLINFRSSLIEYLIDEGHKLTVLVPKEKYDTGNKTKKLKSIGVVFKSYSLSRTGLNPFKDYSSFKSICYSISQIKPDIVPGEDNLRSRSFLFAQYTRRPCPTIQLVHPFLK